MQGIFVGFVPCPTSQPFFPMTLMPLWFLVFKGHDLLHAQVYVYVCMHIHTCETAYKTTYVCIFFFKKKKHFYVYFPKSGA